MVRYYFPDMLSTSDYYAFGMQMPERNYSSGYRYLFGGQEADNEVHNNVNNYTAEYWQFDSRLGRRWENDPIVKSWESPYATFANNPVIYTDPLGLDIDYGKIGQGGLRNRVKAAGVFLFSKSGRQNLLKWARDKSTIYQFHENKEGDEPSLASGGDVKQRTHFDVKSKETVDNEENGKNVVSVNYSKAFELKGEFKFNTNVVDNVTVALNSYFIKSGPTGWDNTHAPEFYGFKGSVNMSDHNGWTASFNFGSSDNGINTTIKLNGGVMYDNSGTGTPSFAITGGGVLAFDSRPSLGTMIYNGDGQIYGTSGNPYISFRLTKPTQTFSSIHYGPFGLLRTKPVLIPFDANQPFYRRPGIKMGQPPINLNAK